ncbi:class I SAM-dependent methyltransferase [Paenibacillus cremeus]|uniref:Class I SAM-dependent methyltransferase n=1 Tax=Paenibacillus cremeus TaxID=2163881 RepID=A0A559KBR5_9BACL|nr:class I SAM-dependent methyltransferase [Paenibacillus cremeus]TVY09561.1 class I SAM-dependent methyltransferase [Paenibacillus cremeus]
MPIEFHDEKNKHTYVGRRADQEWLTIIEEKVDVKGTVAVDIGCGGGVYSIALADLGAAEVIGVDFSEAMLQGAREYCAGYSQIRFKQGSAADTGLQDASACVVLERALIHHLTVTELKKAMKEARRILKNGGTLIVQDRTPEDCLLEGSREHARGYWFERFPKLASMETKRRHSLTTVGEALREAGFRQVEAVQLWETRKRYVSFADYREELLQRTGRSILHELTDEELKVLADRIESEAGYRPQDTVVEKDRWTVWFAKS